MRYKKTQTSPEVYAVIMAKHRADLTVFESYSNPDGHCPLGSGSPEMFTSFGFKGSDFPTIAARTTWEDGGALYKRYNEKTEYWLCSGINEES